MRGGGLLDDRVVVCERMGRAARVVGRAELSAPVSSEPMPADDGTPLALGASLNTEILGLLPVVLPLLEATPVEACLAPTRGLGA